MVAPFDMRMQFFREMTKRVRIENADTSNIKVLVQVWDKGAEGQPDTMAFERVLSPCDLADDVYLTSTRYVVVKEATPEEAKPEV